MTRSPTAKSQAEDPARKLKTRTLIVTSLGYFIVILDTTAKNVALPQIGADLHVGISSLQWIIASYLVVFAAFLLTGGALSDRLGARRVFSAGLAVFGVGSVLSAVSIAPGLIIGGQAVAGLGAALVTPASLALLAATFTDPGERGKALGVWATIAGAGTALGPLIGGALVSVAGWQAVFLVNVPIVLAGIFMVRSWLPEAARNPSRSADVSGQMAGIVALAALSYGVVNAGNHGWGSLGTLGALAAAVVAGCAFVSIESHASAPMLPLGLLRSTRLSSSVLAGGAVNFGTFGLFFLLTLYFQDQKGFSPLQTGLAELPLSGVCVFVPIYAGRLVARIGPRVPLAGGLALAGIGAFGLSPLDPSSAYLAAVPGLLLVGVGVSIAIPAMAAAAMSGVVPSEVGIASGVLNTSRQIGAVLGVAVLGSVVNSGSFSSMLPWALVLIGAVQLAGGMTAFVGLRPTRPAATRVDIAQPGRA